MAGQETQTIVRYFVVRFTDGWKIISGGRRWGRFGFQVDAVDAALRLAREAAGKGFSTEVLVQELWGEVARLEVA